MDSGTARAGDGAPTAHGAATTGPALADAVRPLVEEWAIVTGYGVVCGYAYGAVRGVAQGKNEALRLGEVPYRRARDEMYRVGAREMLRFGSFVGLLSGCELGLRYFRQRDDLWNLAAAGTVTGAVFRARGGLAAAGVGGALGLGLSLVLGSVRSALKYAQSRLVSA